MPLVKLIINNYNLLITNISPFFLIHGYYIKLIQIKLTLYIINYNKSFIKKSELIIRKLA
jgi:hypothetical protein